jgi:asparagine synthetase B (glutamine-hydrolysing)
LPDRLRAAGALRTGDPGQLRCDHLAYWLGFSLRGNEIVSRQGLEIRHPWCDLEVLMFFQRLPAAYRTRHGWTKWVVRQACEPALGTDVVWHSGKRHLGAALNRQVLEDAAPYLRTLLQEQRQALQAYVRDDAVAQAMAVLARPAELEEADCDTVSTIVGLAGWLRIARHNPGNDHFNQGNPHA